MKNIVNKKSIILIISTILLLSALLYNLLYINNKKNEIIEEIGFEGNNNNEEEKEEKIEKVIYIDVAGAVDTPGLYGLPEGSRVNDAICVAGGIKDNADLTNINLAYILSDEMKIIIPEKEKEEEKPVISKEYNVSSVEKSKGLTNINTASESSLIELTGIGSSTAKKIIEYRNKNGNFNNKEEIKNVSGIGEAKYNKIKDDITT